MHNLRPTGQKWPFNMACKSQISRIKLVSLTKKTSIKCAKIYFALGPPWDLSCAPLILINDIYTVFEHSLTFKWFSRILNRYEFAFTKRANKLLIKLYPRNFCFASPPFVISILCLAHGQLILRLRSKMKSKGKPAFSLNINIFSQNCLDWTVEIFSPKVWISSLWKYGKNCSDFF